MIEWSKLKSYQNDKRKSFEMLSYVIAEKLYEKKGKFTPIDDSGGGDGVEFYLTLPNGEEWGWQAKFFDSSRLNHGGRKNQIEKSLEKTLKVHKRLTKWFLCTNSDFTPEENKYFNITLSKKIPKRRKIELIHWGESSFMENLYKKEFSGLQNYFFGNLELSLEWFIKTFEKQLLIVKGKYENKLHINFNIENSIHTLLLDSEFIKSFERKLNTLLSGLENFFNDINTDILEELFGYGLNNEGDFCQLRSKILSLLNDSISGLQDLIAKINKLSIKEIESLMEDNIFATLLTLEKFIRSYFDDKQWEIEIVESGGIQTVDLMHYFYEHEDKNSNSDVTFNTSKFVKNINFHGDTWLSRIIEIRKIIQKFKFKHLNLLSEAGKGKTHLSCNFINELITKQQPGIYISGQKFSYQDNFTNQILSILDIPKSYNVEEFLNILEELGEVYGCRIPIIIDGLNEASIDGRLSPIWKNDLATFVKDIENRRNIVLVTTCRTSYKEGIWDDSVDNFQYLHGFSDQEIEKAIGKYFAEYKIIANYPLRLLEYFKTPLYLKIFCETQNSDRINEKVIYIGEESIFEIFDEYLRKINDDISRKIGVSSFLNVFIKSLDKFAKYLWENKSRSMPFDQFFRMLDGDNVDWNKSKTKALLDENIILMKDWVGKGENIFFTYDMLAGYIIAKSLLKTDLNAFNDSLTDLIFMDKLFSDNRNNLHPLYDDICKGLASLLPQIYNKFLHDLTNNKNAFSYSIKAIFEINPKYFTHSAIEMLNDLFKNDDNKLLFFEWSVPTYLHINHPLNIDYWSDKIKSMKMNERDYYWSEFIRNTHEFDVEKSITELENISKNGLTDNYAIQRLSLIAKLVMWFLTSTDRMCRDKATRALYYYGRNFTNDFLLLLDYSFDINDPYVNERMVAALYGICMARHVEFNPDFRDEILPKIARYIYDKMFKKGALYSSTHQLRREYAFRIIELAIFHDKNLFTHKEIKRSRPPFIDGGIRKWGREIDSSKDKYRNGNSPLGMDFHNYTIGHLVKGRQNYDYNNKEFKKVTENIIWRIYQLGFTLELFGEIDKEIASRYNNFSSERTNVERYGKKYAWIAYFELAGYREDLGLLKDMFDDPRTFKVDLDPSFPEQKNQLKLVNADFLGNRKWKNKKWILSGGVPDVKPYLEIENLLSNKGHLVLLDGYINQEDKQFSRYRFTFIRSFIVKERHFDSFFKRISKQNLGGRWLPEIFSDHHTFAGEVPWCDIFSNNFNSQFEFELKKIKKNVYQKTLALFKGIKRLSENEELEFWEELKGKYIKSGSLIINYSGDSSNLLDLKLREKGLKLKEIKQLVTINDYLTENFDVVIPVVSLYSSGSFNNLYEHGSVNVLSKDLCKRLNLVMLPQSFDLYDSNLTKASICTGDSVQPWGTGEHFTYIRKDLLDKYLKITDSKLIWAIWGEREIRNENMKIIEDAAMGGYAHKVFYEVVKYKY